MARLFDMMGDALRQTWQAVIPWLAGLPVWVWAAVVVLLLLVLGLRLFLLRRGGGRAAKPELLLSRAELTASGANDGRFQLLAAFSNMHHEPVQLLCIAARGGNDELSVVEATALVTPRRAVELEADLALAGPEGAALELYLYVPSSNARAWRLRVPLSWDPGGQRFKATTLAQTLSPVSKLPEPRSAPREAPSEPAEAPPDSQPAPAPEREKLEFPDEF